MVYRSDRQLRPVLETNLDSVFSESRESLQSVQTYLESIDDERGIEHDILYFSCSNEIRCFGNILLQVVAKNALLASLMPP